MAPESSNSNPANSAVPASHAALLLASVIAGALIYLSTSHLSYAIGFPLDDSWIHQTYSRNVALTGEWAFRPGVPSGGSTAPLWSLLLVPGYWMGLAPYIWTYVLGVLALTGISMTGEWLARRMIAAYRPAFPWVGLFLALEWRMLWAAMSGMETAVHALLLTVILAALMGGSRRHLALGLLTGLSAWVRPDGLTLVPAVILTMLVTESDWNARASAVARYLLGFGLLFIPYLLFNQIVAGTPMPNTFYAKQAEYAAWQARPIMGRLVELALQFLVGPAFFLVPGVIRYGMSAWHRRDWGTAAAMLWCAGYLGLYVARLPLYQHGRYVMPAMPIFMIWGLLGLFEFGTTGAAGVARRRILVAWRAALALMAAAFLVLGARSYATDVALIESEMVVTARWAAAHLPDDALIAAHDIGALGYFDRHQLLDLAGLISPEVVPFIRDEARLAAYLDQQGADYLIAFPAFYPELVQRAELLYATDGEIAPSLGSDNMTIYRWNSPKSVRIWAGSQLETQ